MRVFTGSTIRQQITEDELNSLVADFKRYKSTGILPETFGRDAPYDHPNSSRLVLEEEVQRIHLADAENPWPIYKIQFARTSDKAHLVYCQGAINTEHYLLIAILTPNAHDKAKDSNIMRNLGLAAEKFRRKF